MRGVIAVLTGQELAADKIGNLICGWMVNSKDGSPMKMGAWPALATDVVRFVGQAVAVVVAETRGQARDAAEAVVVDWQELPALTDPARGVADGAPQIHPEAAGNLIYGWALGDAAAVDEAFGQALLEGCVYDGETGQLVTATYNDYCMPRAHDLPSFAVSTTETVCPNNPLGVKGCGEAGAIGSPPAVINAITDAIGKNDLSMPATAQKVWRALGAGTRQAAA